MEIFKLAVWISPAGKYSPEIHSSEFAEYHWGLLRKMNFMDELNVRLGERIFEYELYILTPGPYFYELRERWPTDNIASCIEQDYYDKKSKKHYTSKEVEHMDYAVTRKFKVTEYNHFKAWAEANVELKDREEFLKFLIRGGIKNVDLLLYKGEKLPEVNLPVKAIRN